MASSRPGISSSSSRSRRNNAARIIAQTAVDAKNAAEFEEQGSSFDYAQSVLPLQEVNSNPAPPRRTTSDKVTAYLQHIKKAKMIQPFGCLIAIDEESFKIMAYSENAPEMLTMVSHTVPALSERRTTLGMGTDMRTIFTSASAAGMQKALGYNEVSLLNPILVHCKASGKPFYAIVHRVTGCLIFDFEPVKPSEIPTTSCTSTVSGALQSYKLAAKAIARLQSLPGGSLARLCEAITEEVLHLTGYDRVMVYKFHEDDHGEVYREITKPGMEPYLGLHYPATDIPQAARFLFIKNKVRMICDCRAKPVNIHQDETLPFDITFCGSTLRAAHDCHLQYMANMNSIASLAMAVVINEGEEHDDHLEPGQSSQLQQRPWQQKRKNLWGLVVCHNESPRFLPFPLRYACQFLMQVFSVHVTKELELANQIREKNILRTQTLLCDMLLRETAPVGIITQSPNIMDLVKCDGAALLYDNGIWRLGLTPTKEQIRSIAQWLSEHHMAPTALSTDSLQDAGYPDAQTLGDVVCGMAAAWITSKDILFWFRSHAAAEIRWAGAKHEPDDKDDGAKMHPRSSFKAFLQVTKMKSLPWKDYEMDAIHSLQLILRGTFNNPRPSVTRRPSPSSPDASKTENIMELQTVTNEMVRLIETANAPILAADVNGLISGWNPKIAQLTGLSADDALGKHLLELVEESSMEVVRKMLFSAMQGQEEQKVEFLMKTHGARGEASPVVLVVNACASRDMNGSIAGACFVAQDMTDHKLAMDKFIRIQGDYKAIIHNPSPIIPPIFSADEFGWCSEWNTAMAKLSGWTREQVIDKMLLGEVFGVHNACCRLKNQEAYVKLCIIINNAMTGQGTDKTDFDFVNRDGEYVRCLLSVSKKIDSEEAVTGLFFFLHTASQELQQVIQVQQQSDKSAMKRLKALAYIRNEIRTPLSGVVYAQKTLEATNLNEEQRMILKAGANCHLQLNRVLSDLNVENIMDCCSELEVAEFVLQDVVIAAVSQVMITSSGRGIRIIDSMPDVFVTENLYGDNLRLQQIIADFLIVSVKYSPSGGQVEITASVNKDRLGEHMHLVHLELSITHTGGFPEELLSHMFGNHGELPVSEEGISLIVCRKLVNHMNGDIHYIRKEGKSTFVISLELASATTKTKALALRISE